MKSVRWLLVLLVLSVLVVNGQQIKNSHILSISSGTSFGECVGHCRQSINVMSNLSQVIASREDNSNPPVHLKFPLTSTEWIDLVSLVNMKIFQSLDERIQCPDCAYGGAEWVQIDWTNGSKRVTFESRQTVSGIEELVTKLRQMRQVYLSKIKITKEQIDQLRSIIGGNIILPSDAAYLAAIAIDNGRIQRKPSLIVLPINEYDVSVAIKFARANNIAFTVKGGGHSATGYCLNNDGMVLDMSLLKAKHIHLHDQTLYMQAGLKWREIYEFLNDSDTDLIPIGGGCPTVGVGGFILGGGFSFVSRSYGMASDSLLALTIVMSNGSIRRLMRDDPSMSQEDKDLFWACQGGGGGNFGIVVDMVIKLHKLNALNILIGSLYYPLDRLQEVVGFYNEWIKTIPNTLAVYGMLRKSPASLGQQIQTVSLDPIFNGNYEEGLKLIAPLLALKPIYSKIYNMSLLDYELGIAGQVTVVDNRNAYIRSVVLKKGAFTADVIKICENAMKTAPSEDSLVVWMHTAGKIAENSAIETPYPHRDVEFIFQVKAIWKEPNAAMENIAWAYEFFEQLFLDRHAVGAYVNYIDPLLKDWKKRYYGDNIARLLKVKYAVDPDDIFHFQQGVSSQFEPGNLDFSKPETVDLSPLNRTFVLSTAISIFSFFSSLYFHIVIVIFPLSFSFRL